MIPLLLVLVVTACTGAQAATRPEQNQSSNHVLSLAEVEPLELDDRPLRIVATTSIIGDVVAKVSGSEVEFVTLMAYEQDPHGFQPGAGELTAVAEADVVFVNGWDLEEGLVGDLAVIAGETPIVAVSANIDPMMADANRYDSGSAAQADPRDSQVDPHTWFSVTNVKQWVENVAQVLGDLDPANKPKYDANAQSYLLELEEVDHYLHDQVANIPVDKRILVTNHAVFNYFAEEYGFQIVGTVMPSTSTQAEPSAGDLAELINDMETAGVCTIFSDSASSDNLAQTVAMELSGCDEVKVVPLYTGSLGAKGSGADSYSGMLRVNMDRIVKGLK